MSDNVNRNRSIVSVLVILVVIMSFSSLIYGAYGHKIITNIYNGESFPPLNELIGSQEIHTMEFYLKKADMLFSKFRFFVIYMCFGAIMLIFTKSSERRVKLLVFLFAVGIALNSQFLSYLSPYVINDDVRQHTWWMRQFQDKQLFNSDLLAVYGKNIQPWGVLALYYPVSFIVDPIIAGKILPPILLGVSAVYFYKIIKKIINDETSAVLGALIYSITPVFLRQMVGAHARAFAFPLMIIFVYYLIKRDYLRSFIVIVLQALFYPMTAVLCGMTYFFSFTGVGKKGLFLDISKTKVIYFVLAFVFSVSVLCGKQILTYDPEIGSPVSRSDVADKVEFYNERWPLLPTPFICQELEKNLEKGVFLFRSYRKKNAVKFLHRTLQGRRAFFIAILLFCAVFVLPRKSIPIPKEVYYLLISGILMYKVADIFFLKLYSPRRYLEYSAPLVSVIVFVLFVTGIVALIRNVHLKRGVQLCLFTFVLLNFNLSSNEALVDMAEDKELYEYLATIPADSLLAAHPELADGIPTFSRRKVFIAKDISVPLFNNYWETVKRRTFNFFTAYYSDDPGEIYEFCQKNSIDYFVVDRRHFNDLYILKGVYFEPFSSFVINRTKDTGDFILKNIPDEYKSYNEGDIFVIKTEILKDLGSKKENTVKGQNGK